MTVRLFFRPIQCLLLALTLSLTPAAFGASYTINPGDMLQIDVWNEPDLSRQVLVRPDGFISLPMIGDVLTKNSTAPEVAALISRALTNYMKDVPQVVVSLVNAEGNRIFVIGKVVRPGVYTMSSELDVMQALSLAGGLNTFAAENDILILRRREDGTQISIPFEYSRVKKGSDLETNILLQSRDVVVVP